MYYINVKYISCYIDILQEALTCTGNQELIETIPNIPLFLELGACSQTTISFMELGLSRTTAKILADVTQKYNMDIEATKKFILSIDYEKVKISPIYI